MEIYYLKERPEFIEEFVLLCHEEWGTPWKKEEETQKLNLKIQHTMQRLEKFPTLILCEEDVMIGFISLFEKDCEERPALSPWYATMYIKKEYRGKHLSKLLNDALIQEAKNLNYFQIYLKTELDNYYEKFGFHYLETLLEGEKIYVMELKGNK